MKPDQPYSRRINIKLRSLDISYYRGKTTLTPVVYSMTADFNFSLNNKNSFQVKVPYQWVQGKLGNTAGAGDLSLCLTRTVWSGDEWTLSSSVGAKVPVNRSNKTSGEGLPLPMYYQTSLGTYDGIAGLSLLSRKWLFATGIQVPFNSNGNEFLWGKWSSRPDLTTYVGHYGRANELKRGTDVMMRAERNFRFSRLNASIGVLPIWRITRDEFVAGQGIRVKQSGTTGMAMSAIATLGYNFGVKNGIRFLYGKKLTQRSVNPDGLTRRSVFTITYSHRF
ncbi:MAG: hypothetical protein ACKO3B_06275 [Bacteroidota bacterium]